MLFVWLYGLWWWLLACCCYYYVICSFLLVECRCTICTMLLYKRCTILLCRQKDLFKKEILCYELLLWFHAKRHFNVHICSWWSDTSFPFLINIILFCLDTTVTSAEVLSTCYGNLLWYHFVQFVNLRDSLHMSLSGVSRICAFSLVSIYPSYGVAVAKIAGELGTASPATRSATVWTLNTPSQLKLASRITILLEFRKSSMHAWNGIHFHTGDESDNANELPYFSRSLQNCGDSFSDGTIHASSYIVLIIVHVHEKYLIKKKKKKKICGLLPDRRIDLASRYQLL